MQYQYILWQYLGHAHTHPICLSKIPVCAGFISSSTTGLGNMLSVFGTAVTAPELKSMGPTGRTQLLAWWKCMPCTFCNGSSYYTGRARSRVQLPTELRSQVLRRKVTILEAPGLQNRVCLYLALQLSALAVHGVH